MDVSAQIPVQVSASNYFGYIYIYIYIYIYNLESGLLDHMVIVHLIVGGATIVFSTMAYAILYSHYQCTKDCVRTRNRSGSQFSL
jgi:hypothetical protein